MVDRATGGKVPSKTGTGKGFFTTEGNFIVSLPSHGSFIILLGVRGRPGRLDSKTKARSCQNNGIIQIY